MDIISGCVSERGKSKERCKREKRKENKEQKRQRVGNRRERMGGHRLLDIISGSVGERLSPGNGAKWKR